MDPLLLLSAFILGYAVKQVGLPPLVGFLTAGFVLNYFGIESGEILKEIADLGVILLLFTIGLKLKVKNLLRKEIWATSSLHMIITVLFFSSLIWIGSLIGIDYFTDLDTTQVVLISFALGFSSTVFAVKILEETGTLRSTHGRIAVGILIIQDVFAVLFLTLTANEAPSPWAFALLLLLFIPWLLSKTPLTRILDDSGHGELFLLLGVLIPVIGATVFSATGLKADLGALVLGILLSGHRRSSELADTLMDFKDLFLVGFFVSIGLSGLPSWEEIGVAAFFTLLLPIKFVLFFLILTRFKLRARTSFLTTLNLASYSEFGLIVAVAAVSKLWLTPEWVLILALSVSFTFILSSPLVMISDKIYARFQNRLLAFESEERLKEDEPVEFSREEVIVFGMGRTGNKVYEVMQQNHGKKVLGIDQNEEKIKLLSGQGKNVIQGDARDLNFWQRINLKSDPPVIILATSSHVTHMKVIEQLKQLNCELSVAAISRFEDEMIELRDAGVQTVFNLYEEAGAGFADNVFNSFYKKDPT